MISNVWKTSLLILASMSAATVASADNINTSGVICHNYNAAEALDIDYYLNGVQNVKASPRSVICAIPRPPLPWPPPPPESVLFYVDGKNSPNTTTGCSVVVYDYQGKLMAIQSFSESGGASGSTWDFAVTLQSLQYFPAWYDYASLLCTLPATFGGQILGVTTVQW